MLNPIFIRLARAFPMVALALCGALVSACGGGGGSGSGGGGTLVGIGGEVPQGPPPPLPALSIVSVAAANNPGVADDCRAGTDCGTRAATIRANGEFGNLGFRHNPLDRVNAEYAHARGFTGRGVAVAVVDGGIDIGTCIGDSGHPELAGRIAPGFDAFRQGSPEDPDCENPYGHGTAVAGIIAAAKNNDYMHGVAPDATVVPVRVLANPDNDENHPSFSGFNNALRRAVDNAFVVNNSWGSGAMITFNIVRDGQTLEVAADRPEKSVDPETRAALLSAANRDAVVVFAAGNNGWNSETGIVAQNCGNPESCPPAVVVETGEEIYNIQAHLNLPGEWGNTPGRHPEVLGQWLHVVALDRSDHISDFSNGCGYAMNWCLAAPGEWIRTTDARSENNPDGRQTFRGTSAAAPFVSGAAAVLKSAFPNLGAKQVGILLLMTARDLGEPGVDEVYGHGLVDLEKATRPQTHPACGVGGYDCPKRDPVHRSGLRLAAAQSGGDGMKLSDFRLSPTEESRIAPSPVFGDAFNRTRAQVGFVDAFDRAYQTDLSRFAASPPRMKSDAAKAARIKSETTTRKLANGFFIRTDGDGSPRMFGWRGRSDGRDAESESGNGGGNGLSAALLESRRDVVDGGGGSGREFDLAFALGAERWRGMEVGAGGFAAGMRAAEFSQTGAGMRQWFVSRKFSGNGFGFENGSVLKNASDRNGGGAGGSGAGGSGVGGSGGWVLESELGMLDESETTLGATFSGAFANGGARTFYGRVSASADLGFGGNGNLGLGLFGRDAKAFAGLLAMRTDAGGVFSELRSRGWELGLSGDDWRLRLMSPLRIRSGALRWRGVGGYDDAGHYRATESQADMSSSDSRRLTFTTKAMGAWWSAESTATGATRFSLSASRTF